MSHVASVQCYITDLDALDVVAKKLGLKLLRGQTSYKWYGVRIDNRDGAGVRSADFGKSEHVLALDPDCGRWTAQQIKSAYQIGLKRRDDGGPGWDLVYDDFGQSGRLIANACGGTDLRAIKAGVAEEVATRQLRRMGMRVNRIVDTKTGVVRLVGVK